MQCLENDDMAEKIDNALRFLNAYASIERSLNRQQCRSDFMPFKKLVRVAAKNNRIVARNEETLLEYADLRNAIVHQRGRHEEVIAEPLDSVAENIEQIADLLDSDETALSYSSRPVMCADENTTVMQAYEILHKIDGVKLPVYIEGKFAGLVTMEEIAGWALKQGSSEEPVKNLIQEDDEEHVIFIDKKESIMDAVLVFDEAMSKSSRSPVLIVTETGSPEESPMGILSSHDLSRILAALL